MAKEFAAVLIDFENIYYFLKNNLPGDRQGITGLVVEMVRSLNAYLMKEFDESVISLDAYADFDRIDESAQSELYLLGVETHNVLGTDTKNAADMKLCIDTLDIFYNRKEVTSFIFVAGDRDYIPVIQYLKKRGRVVRVVGFPQSTSGDLVQIVGKDNFIAAQRFIPAMQAEMAKPPVAAKVGGTPVTSMPISGTPMKLSALQAAMPGPPVPVMAPVPAWKQPEDDLGTDLERYELSAIDAVLRHFGDKREIWLVPYLHKLRAEMPQLTESERKRIVSRLEQKGAFKVEKRKGGANEFSVIVVNWNHQIVRDSSLRT